MDDALGGGEALSLSLMQMGGRRVYASYDGEQRHDFTSYRSCLGETKLMPHTREPQLMLLRKWRQNERWMGVSGWQTSWYGVSLS